MLWAQRRLIVRTISRHLGKTGMVPILPKWCAHFAPKHRVKWALVGSTVLPFTILLMALNAFQLNKFLRKCVKLKVQ